MVDVINRRGDAARRGPDSENGSWPLFIAGAAAILFYSLMGYPSSNSWGDDPPPAGIEVYRSGEYECWDKVVCCDETKRETCATIPICRVPPEV